MELRVILAVIGAIILAVIYYLGTRKKPQDSDSIDSKIEPGFENSLPLRSANELPRKSGNITIDQAHDKLQEEHQKEHQEEQNQSTKNKIVTLFLHAKDGQQFDW
ncbi:MAG: hypothetical protein L3J83_11050, partial [Proteobacteria bacterium]|nr:hypothetical protein [Pseudomonadota bacterium]